VTIGQNVHFGGTVLHDQPEIEARAYTIAGRQLDARAIKKRLSQTSVVLISIDGNFPPREYTQYLKPRTIVFVFKTPQLSNRQFIQLKLTGTEDRAGGAASEVLKNSGQIVPRWKRFDIAFDVTDLPLYKDQLNFFEIELGVASNGTKHVDYYSAFGQGDVHRSGDAKGEKRIYLLPSRRDVQQADRRILKDCGVDVDGELLMQFYAKTLEDRLAWVEKTFAEKQNRADVTDIRKTVFGVRPVDNGTAERAYQFHVLHQTYRDGTRIESTGNAAELRED
jgi:hypothetical protein